MVLVDAAHRHRGIASQLVDACVASLREAGRVPVLDATPAGAAVYAKIGFVAGFAFERWEGERRRRRSRADDSASAHRGGAGARRETLIALDRSACGVDRALLLRSFLARPATRAWLAAARRAASRCAAPVVAPRRSVRSSPPTTRPRSSCSAFALDGVAGRVFIDVPVHRRRSPMP